MEMREIGGNVIHVDKFSSELCKVLGLDGGTVGAIDISVRPMETKVTIVRYLWGEDAEHVKRLVEKYDLVAREGE